jgi:putative transposase
MPDHVHFLLSFRNEETYQKIIGDWKRSVARRHGIKWQDNFFEHRLRGEKSLDQKARYLESNPVRAGLVLEVKDWPYFWQPGI